MNVLDQNHQQYLLILIKTKFHPLYHPKKNQLEPDYEVIEFSGQQYSNASPIRTKTPESKNSDGLKCTLCGSSNPWVRCEQCPQQIFCSSCDDMFHRHPKRQMHLRKAIEKNQNNIKPPLPPKTSDMHSIAPVPPPRRNKKGLPSPLSLRKEQVLRSPASSNSSEMLKRSTNLSTRPLPNTPNQQQNIISRTPSPRSSTPNNRSIFDSIQRPPSLTLERIRTKASATLDRMAILQQRYRQHQESSKQKHNSNEDSSINLNDQMNMEQQQTLNHQSQGMKNMSASVFNLNRIDAHHRPPPRPWSPAHIQQAQSVACMNCNTHQSWNHGFGASDGWIDGGVQGNLNGSNMSLNLPPTGYYPGIIHQHGPPPAWVNAWGAPPMYPYPYPVMANGMVNTPLPMRSRAHSRIPSRAASPALSTKSRKSIMSLKNKRNTYTEPDATDDEDSEDDKRSVRSAFISNNRRQRKNSVISQQSFENDNDSDIKHKSKSSKNRGRSGSISKINSTQWLPAPSSSSSSGHQFVNVLRNRSERGSISSFKKLYSDSPLTPDSESSEPATKALVQAKIQEKITQQKKEQELTNKEQHKIQETEKETQDNNVNNLKKSESPLDLDKIDDSPTLGPPPSPPTYEWECEFCTFVNEPNTKICSICCKTPTSPPKQIQTFNKNGKVNKNTTKIAASENETSIAEDHLNKGLNKKENQSNSMYSNNAMPNYQNQTEINNDNNIKSTEVINSNKNNKTKVSTSCGPSPPREIKVKKSSSGSKKSTGTSPPPQSISTQTYGELSMSKISLENNNSFQKSTNQSSAEGRRSRLSERSQSRQSIKSDSQSLPPTPPKRNMSPSGMGRRPTIDVSLLDPETLNFIDRNLVYFRDLPLMKSDRYKNQIDLRQEDLYNQHKPSISDILNYQKMQSKQKDKTGNQRDPGLELVFLLKEAEHYKYTAEELQAALKHCGEAHPITWLRENWTKLIQTVQTLATKYGQECKENTIGTISSIEARESLRIHKGNLWHAITECIEQRQRKYDEIASQGNYSREDIVTALTAHHGNLELAMLDLNKTQLKPFLMRIWGPSTGVENESGNNVEPPPNPALINNNNLLEGGPKIG